MLVVEGGIHRRIEEQKRYEAIAKHPIESFINEQKARDFVDDNPLNNRGYGNESAVQRIVSRSNNDD